MKKDYKQFSLNLAKKAGKIIKANFDLGMKKEWKEDSTPLTQTDLELNQFVIDSIKKEFPGHTIFSEEGNHLSKKSDLTWVCDPLDGTIPFSHGIPTCVFSLALVKNGESILGVVYDPFMDRMFFAEKGKGAFLNKKKIKVSKNNPLSESVIGIVWWPGALFNFLELTKHLLEERTKLLNLLSITYMGSLVANGELAATIFAGNKPHDTAALKVIIEEAGGKVTDIFGNEQRYDQEINGHLIANPALHNKLLEIIKQKVKGS